LKKSNKLKCPSCSATKVIKLKYKGKYRIYDCSNCELGFVYPFPTKKEIDDFYLGQKVLSVGVSNKKVDDYLANKDKYWNRYKKRINFIRKYKDKGLVLDIGSAGGVFLDLMKHQGFGPSGIEPSSEGVKAAKKIGIKTMKGMLDDFNIPKERYDIITWFDVIEHITNPKEQIKKIEAALKKNGILYISTPNFSGFLSKWLKSQWPMYCPPEHLLYFSPNSLSFSLEQAGLKVESVRTLNPGYRYFANLLVKGLTGKDLNGYTEKYKNNVFIITLYYILIWPFLVASLFIRLALRINKTGDCLEVIAVKE
jgi:2-polyprenyl-3-methyl-5-hydroxy-6-metoxy-1,4-benzoquinol methylase